MADKRPLCLYGGHVKRLQPGDTLIGAYNATEAGWIVNASGWLVATPGSVKLVDRNVCGTITPVTNGGIKLVDNNDGIVMRTAPGTATDWGYVGIGSACTPQSRLHLNVKGSGANYLQFSNDTTAHGNDSGFSVGINSSEQPRLWNFENTNMRFATNNLIRMRIKAAGGLHAYYTASVDGAMDVGGAFVGRSTASIDSNLNVGGNLDVTGAFVGRSTASIDGVGRIGDGLCVGSSLTSPAIVGVHINAKGSGQSLIKFTNDTTGHTSGDGTEAGIDSSEQGYVWNYENTKLYFGTNNTERAYITAGGDFVAKNNASVNTNLNVGGNLDVGGDLVVTGSLRVVASTLYLGDNQFGNAQTDTQLMYGNVTVYNDVAASLVVTGNASINGNLVVGGTGAFGNTVTITQDVQVDAGRYLYLDGGLDTYLTASNDIITMHVGTASMWALSENGVALGSAITAPAGSSDIFHGARKGTNSYLRLTNGSTGHTNNDGVLIGPNGTTQAYLLSYDSPWSIWASNTHVATILNTGLKMANTMKIYSDQVIGRDSGGLGLYDDSGSAQGITIADGGTVTFTHGITANSTASVGGAVNIHGVTHIHNNASVSGTVTHDSTFLQTGAMTAKSTITAAGNIIANASVLASAVLIGGTGKARLKNCAINASGTITAYNGSSLMLNSLDDTSPDQSFIADKVWNAVYNDVVDWQDLADDEGAFFGKVYVDSYVGARLPTRRCQKSVIGICSDTFGFAVGRIQNRRQIPVSVAGWCLAYVDKQYESGEPLTNTSSGCLTAMNATEKREYPERLVAIYKRPEQEEKWQDKVMVNGRHWVKVK